ncbi:MAG: chaperone modulator CbpM [Gammaproteobacteria bacterium]|nr:chaperone modulator CbpM [Gammaproteobacteria bacterium]
MSNEFLTGIVLDEECLLTLDELSRACAVQTDWIIELVDEGVLEPRGGDVSHWVFSGISLHRARTARRLQQDLGINIAGAALALDLMEEIEDLRAHLCVLEREG